MTGYDVLVRRLKDTQVMCDWLATKYSDGYTLEAMTHHNNLYTIVLKKAPEPEEPKEEVICIES